MLGHKLKQQLNGGKPVTCIFKWICFNLCFHMFDKIQKKNIMLLGV